MAIAIRRLGPEDEPVLELLAKEDADFDVEGRGTPRKPLEADDARRYLANPSVLYWVAYEGNEVVGSLYCALLPLRSDNGRELLLYEIGVRKLWRRRGVGRALMAHMEEWMRANGVADVWVLADNPVAVDFYRANEFLVEAEQPVFMKRTLKP